MGFTLMLLADFYVLGYFARLLMLCWEDHSNSRRRSRIGLPPRPSVYTFEDLFLIPFAWPVDLARALWWVLR